MWFLVLGLACLLAACSHYQEPITNAPDQSGVNGLPGLAYDYGP